MPIQARNGPLPGGDSGAVRTRTLGRLGDVVTKGPTPELPRVFALPAKSPETEVLQVGLRSVLTNQYLYIYEPRERHSGPYHQGPGFCWPRREQSIWCATAVRLI